MPAAFIDDGYTLTETVTVREWKTGEDSAKTGATGPVIWEIEVTYRPPTYREQERHDARIDAYNLRRTMATNEGRIDDAEQEGDKAALEAAKHLAKHLVSWSLEGPITAERMLTMHPRLFEALLAQITFMLKADKDKPSPREAALGNSSQG